MNAGQQNQEHLENNKVKQMFFFSINFKNYYTGSPEPIF